MDGDEDAGELWRGIQGGGVEKAKRKSKMTTFRQGQPAQGIGTVQRGNRRVKHTGDAEGAGEEWREKGRKDLGSDAGGGAGQGCGAW